MEGEHSREEHEQERDESESSDFDVMSSYDDEDRLQASFKI